MPSVTRLACGACARSARRSLATVGVSLALLAAFGCKYQPKRPQVHFDLSEETRALADGRPKIPLDVQDHMRGSLEMLFGTPSNPQYMLVSDWIDDSFDPNWPTYPADDRGSGEFTEDDLEGFKRENREALRVPLAHIANGEWDLVAAPDWAVDLQRKWNELSSETPADQRNEDFKKEASALFEEFYPTLRDSAELYRQQCLHCHGPEGGGNGPTAEFLDPLPRDYRKGIFKFTPLKDKAVPRRRDLYAILDQGVTGTAMPSFRRFTRPQLEGLVDYVRLLSMRGMVENDLRATYEIDEVISAEAVLESYKTVFEKWRKSEQEAEAFVVSIDGDVPAPTPQSIARGRELFMDAKTGNCFSCHGEAGRGDGISAWTVDPESGHRKEAYNDDWGHPIRPRNLTQGIFRGGRRPIDIYRRIKAGINGTPMPALGTTLPDSDLWAMVHYVGSLTEGGLFYPENSGHAVAQSAQH